MTTVCHQENKNSFAMEDWKAAAVPGQGPFTSATAAEIAPKVLVSFEWSSAPRLEKHEATPVQECLIAIKSLFEHSMTKKEAACFRREMASKFAPLRPEQTRLLPPRTK